MSDGSFPDRLSQLKTRWESDPSSRIFLQLAEEYRHQGRVKEALAVLDKGLQEHPGYLSALVAKGRCHLELSEGEAARAVLERVVKQDATQMVANKLLVRAYLETGEPARARERLDLYSLLNDSDPEIAELRRQIKAMDRPKEPSPLESPFDLGPAPAPSSAPAASAANPTLDDDIFGLGPAPAPKPAAASAADEPFGDLLFPQLAKPASREGYLESLSAEGIFDLGPAAPAPTPPTSPIIEPSPFAEEPPPVFAADPGAPDTSWIEEAPSPSLSSPAATVTLGELYLRQGHLDEADRIFREILEREPDNAAARAGLGVVGDSRCTIAPPTVPEPMPESVQEVSAPEPEPAAAPLARLDARDLLAGFNPAAKGGGTTARKIHLLTHYLDRIRGGSQPDVS